MRISDWSSDVCSSDLAHCYLMCEGGTGQDRDGRAGMDAGRHLRHQSLRTGLDSFGAEYEWQIAHRRVAENRAQMLCGSHHQNGIADGEIIKACRRLDCRSEEHTSELTSLK